MRRPKATERISHRSAELCLNLWYFFDETNTVIRLARKCNAHRGSDEDKLTIATTVNESPRGKLVALVADHTVPEGDA